jgi:hypothetical protein
MAIAQQKEASRSMTQKERLIVAKDLRRWAVETSDLDKQRRFSAMAEYHERRLAGLANSKKKTNMHFDLFEAHPIA